MSAESLFGEQPIACTSGNFCQDSCRFNRYRDETTHDQRADIISLAQVASLHGPEAADAYRPAIKATGMTDDEINCAFELAFGHCEVFEI